MFGFNRNKPTVVRRTAKEMQLSQIELDIKDAQAELAAIERDIGKAYQRKARVYEQTMADIIQLDDDLSEAGLPQKVPISIGNVGEGNYTDIIAGVLDDPKLGIPKVAQGAIRKFLSGEKGDYINSVIDSMVNQKLTQIGSQAQPRKEIEQ